jgi:hypothetical protein
MKITREKAMALYGLFNRLKNIETNVKFHYVRGRNQRLLEDEIKTIQEAAAPPVQNERYAAFEKERIALCSSYAQKDEQGKPLTEEIVLVNGSVSKSFVMAPESRDEFNAKMEGHKKEYADVIELLGTREKQLFELFHEEVDIEFTLIPMSIMPDKLDGDEVDLLYDLIIEDK